MPTPLRSRDQRRRAAVDTSPRAHGPRLWSVCARQARSQQPRGMVAITVAVAAAVIHDIATRRVAWVSRSPRVGERSLRADPRIAESVAKLRTVGDQLELLLQSTNLLRGATARVRGQTVVCF